MAKCLDNKLRLIFNSKFLVLCSLLSILSFIFFCILYPNRANSGPYLESAHGDATYGVLRTSLSIAPNNYGRGNCAHCHEQHTSIGGIEPAPGSPSGPDFYLLFKDLWVAPPQSNEFCFGCHMGVGSCGTGTGSCQSDWKRTNYSYSYWASGDNSLTCPSSIYESFQFVANNGIPQSNCGSIAGSSHLIQDLGIFIAGKAGFPSNYNYINPCSACHNPHRVKRDPFTSTGRIGLDGNLVSAVSRPSQHTNLTTWELWGDETDERMSYRASSLGGIYCAPYRFNSTTSREPDGCSAPATDCTTDCSNGLRLIDYIRLCTDCHNTTNVIKSTRLGRNLFRINWTSAGDFHGGRWRIDNGGSPEDFTGPDLEWGDLLEPYKDRASGTYASNNFVLSCLDCHEPHGSQNEFLLRKTVNGTQFDNISGNGKWFYWCRACHRITLVGVQAHTGPLDEHFNCFDNGACHRHCDGTDCSSRNFF